VAAVYIYLFIVTGYFYVMFVYNKAFWRIR